MKRVQVDNPVTPPPITPAAEPVNTYYRPKIPAPALQTIIDLSPLSETFANIADAEQKRTAREAALAGAADAESLTEKQLQDFISGAVDAKDELTKNQEAYAKKIANGELEPYASPHFAKAYMQTVGRRAAMRYAGELESLVASASAATDGNGEPAPPADLAELKAKAWEKYAKSPFMQDRFSAEQAVALKNEADVRFDAAVLRARGQARLEFVQKETVNELTQFMRDTLTSPGHTLSDEQRAQVWGFLTERVRRGNIGDPKAVLFSATRALASQMEAEGDLDGAVEFLRNARGLSVGNTTLGKDAKTSIDMNTMIEQMENRRDQELLSSERVRNAEIEDAKDAASKTWLKGMLEARSRGISAASYVASLTPAALAENAFGPRTAEAVQWMQAVAAESDRTQASVGAETANRLVLEAYRGGDVPALTRELHALAEVGTVSAGVALDTLGKLQAAGDVTEFLERSPVYSGYARDIEAATRSVTGLPEPVQTAFDTEVRSILDQYTSGVAAIARANRANPALIESETRKLGKEALTAVTQRKQEIETRRQQAEVELNDAVQRGRTTTALLEKHADVLSADRRRQWQDAGDRAARKEEFWSSDDWRQSTTLLEATVQDELANLGSLEKIDGARASLDVLQYAKTNAEAWIAANQSKYTTAELLPLFRVALRDEIMPAAEKYLKDSVKPRGVARSAQKDNLELAGTLAQGDRKAVAKALTDPARLPGVSDDYRETVRRFYQGQGRELMNLRSPTAGFWGISKEQVQDSAFLETAALFMQPELGDKDRTQAIVGAYSVIGGITIDDVVRGTKTLTLPPNVNEYLADADSRARDALRDLGITDVAKQDEVLYSRDLNAEPLRSTTTTGPYRPEDVVRRYAADLRGARATRLAMERQPLDLSTAKIDPYNSPLFESKEALRAWTDARFSSDPPTLSPEETDGFRRLGLDPTNIEMMRGWRKAQEAAIQRISAR